MQNDVIEFWFNELEPKQWWQKSAEFDQIIESRFGNLHRKAAAGELYSWRETALGSLAEIIVLDQFSRNIYRNLPEAFVNDGMALALSQFAIFQKFDTQLSAIERVFLYMPFMHSESAAIHEQAVELFESAGLQSNLEFELRHKAIIDRFGRYPHRNKILGRPSTEEEIQFLKQPGSGF